MRYLLIATLCLCSSVCAAEKTAEEREAAKTWEQGKEIFTNFSNLLFGVKPNQDNAKKPNQGGVQMLNQGDVQMPVGPPQLFTSLTAEQARYGVALYRQQKQAYLDLSGLSSIDVDVARELANFRPIVGGMIPGIWADDWGWAGSLSLNGLTSITPEVARELAKVRTNLRLNGLSSITPEVARELRNLGRDPATGGHYKAKGFGSRALPNRSYKLSLNGLTSITPEVARELIRTLAKLSLGVQNIDIDTAEQLMRYEGDGLVIRVNVRSLSPGVMAYLKQNEVITVVNTAGHVLKRATR